MADVFVRLLNMSLSASVLILAVILLRPALRHAPAWVANALWGIAALRLVLPFSLESALSLIPSAEPINAEAVQFSPPTGAGGAIEIIDTGIQAVNNAVNPIISAAVPDGAAPVNPLYTAAAAAGVIWLLGVAAMLVYALGSYMSLRSRVSTATRLADGVWQSEHVESPFVLGVLRPQIYLPYGIADADIEQVLSHERAHIARYDTLLKPLGYMVLTLHWFNPLVWCAWLLFCRDIERGCDERVVRDMDGASRAAYSEALLRCSAKARRISACPLAFGENDVKSRIKSVLNYKKPAFWVIIACVAVCLVLAVCFLTNPVSAAPDTEIFFYADEDCENPLPVELSGDERSDIWKAWKRGGADSAASGSDYRVRFTDGDEVILWTVGEDDPAYAVIQRACAFQYTYDEIDAAFREAERVCNQLGSTPLESLWYDSGVSTHATLWALYSADGNFERFAAGREMVLLGECAEPGPFGEPAGLKYISLVRASETETAWTYSSMTPAGDGFALGSDRFGGDIVSSERVGPFTSADVVAFAEDLLEPLRASAEYLISVEANRWYNRGAASERPYSVANAWFTSAQEVYRSAEDGIALYAVEWELTLENPENFPGETGLALEGDRLRCTDRLLILISGDTTFVDAFSESRADALYSESGNAELYPDKYAAAAEIYYSAHMYPASPDPGKVETDGVAVDESLLKAWPEAVIEAAKMQAAMDAAYSTGDGFDITAIQITDITRYECAPGRYNNFGEDFTLEFFEVKSRMAVATTEGLTPTPPLALEDGYLVTNDPPYLLFKCMDGEYEFITTARDPGAYGDMTGEAIELYANVFAEEHSFSPGMVKIDDGLAASLPGPVLVEILEYAADKANLYNYAGATGGVDGPYQVLSVTIDDVEVITDMLSPVDSEIMSFYAPSVSMRVDPGGDWVLAGSAEVHDSMLRDGDGVMWLYSETQEIIIGEISRVYIDENFNSAEYPNPYQAAALDVYRGWQADSRSFTAGDVAVSTGLPASVAPLAREYVARIATEQNAYAAQSRAENIVSAEITGWEELRGGYTGHVILSAEEYNLRFYAVDWRLKTEAGSEIRPEQRPLLLIREMDGAYRLIAATDEEALRSDGGLESYRSTRGYGNLYSDAACWLYERYVAQTVGVLNADSVSASFTPEVPQSVREVMLDAVAEKARNWARLGAQQNEGFSVDDIRISSVRVLRDVAETTAPDGAEVQLDVYIPEYSARVSPAANVRCYGDMALEGDRLTETDDCYYIAARDGGVECVGWSGPWTGMELEKIALEIYEAWCDARLEDDMACTLPEGLSASVFTSGVGESGGWLFMPVAHGYYAQNDSLETPEYQHVSGYIMLLEPESTAFDISWQGGSVSGVRMNQNHAVLEPLGAVEGLAAPGFMARITYDLYSPGILEQLAAQGIDVPEEDLQSSYYAVFIINPDTGRGFQLALDAGLFTREETLAFARSFDSGIL